MPIQMTEKEAAAFFAQIKRPMPESPEPAQPTIKPGRPKKRARPVRAPETPARPSRLSYALGYSSVMARNVRPHWLVAATILGYLVTRAVLDAPTF